MFQVRKELLIPRGYVIHGQEKEKLSTVRHCQEGQICPRAQDTIIDDPSMLLRFIAKHLQVMESRMRHMVLEDHRYQSYMMRRGQFMSHKTRENHVICLKHLPNNYNHSQQLDILWLAYMRTLTKTKGEQETRQVALCKCR